MKIKTMLFLVASVAVSFSLNLSADTLETKSLVDLVKASKEDGNVFTCDAGKTEVTRFEGSSYVLQRIAMKEKGMVVWVNMSTNPATGYAGLEMTPDGAEQTLPLAARRSRALCHGGNRRQGRRRPGAGSGLQACARR